MRIPRTLDGMTDDIASDRFLATDGKYVSRVSQGLAFISLE